MAPRRRTTDEGGFTLIELVVAMVVLGAMAAAVVGILMNTQKAGVTNRARIAAANLAAREIDLVRQEFGATDAGPAAVADAGLVTNPHPLDGGTAGQPLVVDGMPYTVTRSAQWNITGTGASACEGGSLVAYPTLGVTVSVTWPHMGSVQPVVSTAALAPDKDTGIPTTDSFIAAKVTDQDAAPLTGIPVRATSGSTVTGFTDATGCAVIRVSPATTGTSYTVSVGDASYVDISGTPSPSKSTGVLNRGSIYTGASFSVAQPGSVTVRLVRADGQPLSNADVAGSKVTLVASEFSGASGATQRTVTGVMTTFPGMWPTTYGAYFGDAPPVGGYPVVDLAPGSNVQLDVEFTMASVAVGNLPAGATRIVAVPAGTATTCGAGSGTSATVAGPTGTLSLVPGTYDLYVVGATFACSPGPAALALGSGENSPVLWGTTQLRLQGVPSGGTVWAVDRRLSGLSSPTTCPTTVAAIARNVDGARSGAIDLPAGDWYVWQTAGAVTAACQSFPDLINPLAVAYGTTTTKSWASTPTYATLRVTGISNNRFLVVSTSTTTCSATTATPVPTLPVQGPTTSSNQTLQVQAPRPTSGTTVYNAYIWNKSSGSGNRCSSIGTFVVGPSSGTLSKTQSSSGPVGP